MSRVIHAVRLPVMLWRNLAAHTTAMSWRQRYAESPWTCR